MKKRVSSKDILLKAMSLAHQHVCLVPELSAVDDQGQRVSEKYFEPGSTILLRWAAAQHTAAA
jgi:hypothetical protein